MPGPKKGDRSLGGRGIARGARPSSAGTGAREGRSELERDRGVARGARLSGAGAGVGEGRLELEGGCGVVWGVGALGPRKGVRSRRGPRGRTGGGGVGCKH